jgi:hypothetical protein
MSVELDQWSFYTDESGNKSEWETREWEREG